MQKTKRRNKMTAADYFIYALLIFGAVIMLYPFWYVIIGSFNNGLDYGGGGVWLLPRKLTIANYQVILSDNRLWIGFANTIARTIIGTFCALIFTSIVAYAMSRPKLKCKKFFRGFNIFTMFFSGGLIPFLHGLKTERITLRLRSDCSASRLTQKKFLQTSPRDNRTTLYRTTL